MSIRRTDPNSPLRPTNRGKFFKHWKLTELHQTFGLTREPKSYEPLVQLLENLPAIGVEDKLFLSELAQKLERNEDVWNEEELKVRFITFLLEKVNFQGKT